MPGKNKPIPNKLPRQYKTTPEQRKQSSEYYYECKQRHPEKWKRIKESQKRSRIKNYLKEKLTAYIYDAKRRSIEWLIDDEDALGFFCQDCFYCGRQPKANDANGIDRNNSRDAYISYNCVSCCKTCNMAKGSMMKDEYITHCIKVAKKHTPIPEQQQK